MIIPFSRRCLVGLFFIILNFFAFVNISYAEWSIQVADAPKSFYGTSFCEPSSRAIVIDTSNHPHIVYGGHELYYAHYDGSNWQEERVDTSSGEVGSFASIALDSKGKAHISYYDVTNDELKYATNASGAWVITTVDSSGDVGGYTSIALDSYGKAHISYYDWTNDDLKYATNASGSWVTTTVDSSGDVGGYISIALDSNGKVYISYFDYYPKSDLKYATNASGSWVTTTVDSSGDVGGYTSIALDSYGKAHISYYDWTNDDLKYATNVSGTWTTTTIDSSGSVGKYSSIALDSSGKAHISHLYITRADLKYTTNASGTWVTTTVDDSGKPMGEYTSIALDSSGKVHISSYDYDRDHHSDDKSILFYTTNATGEWETTTVDRSNEDVGQYTSIALDSKGKAHISYCDYNDSNPKYITSSCFKYATNASGAWITTTVDSGGGSTSIALDSSGKVHISYNGLRYATNVSGKWVTTTVDSSSNSDSDELGTYNSIALDSSGKVHISYSAYYYDNDDGNENSRYHLKYATNASGAWVITTVDSGSNSHDNLGSANSIALDSAGKAHISYCEVDYGNDGLTGLKYATNSSGTWTTTTVDSSGSEEGSTSIALDGSGKAHISYLDSDNYDLKYATNASGVWLTTTVDNSSRGFTSIVLDSYDKAHISYDASGDLGYATNASGSWVTTAVDNAEDVGGFTSIVMDKSDKAHISYYDWTNNTLKYATNADVSSTPTPTATKTPTPTSTATKTPTPTPTPTITPLGCQAVSIEASSNRLTLSKKASDEVTVTVTGDNGCPVQGDTVTASVNSTGKNVISVSPISATTDASGEATFTITAKNKTGNATVTFKEGNSNLRTKVKVKVVK